MRVLLTFFFALMAIPAFSQTGKWTVVAWNDLGMHCMDADYSVFAILPPFNTIHAQVIDASGKLVRGATGITVTYEALADPDGSINTTSAGKTGFWQFVKALFGVSLDPDVGLAQASMPGAANTPRPLTFEQDRNWFTATGIPITPYDDAGLKNPYPMLRVVVRDAAGAVLAATPLVTPVSDEMSCRACHASGSATGAKPLADWVNDPDPERDYRLNILRKHDEAQPDPDFYKRVLATAGFNADGLYATAAGDGRPVLCASCHLSNALPGLGVDGVPPLTRSVHGSHASVTGPDSSLTLDDQTNRDACYQCHPGSQTRCLRGVMGKATAADGSMLMQCQSCHGNMSLVGAATRQGWLEEPTCHNCHTGTATQNRGSIRYVSVFEDPGQSRQPADSTFATQADTPAAGLSLYRFSAGHGGLQCEACHGSTHAEYPTSNRNDNLQSAALQGYDGKLIECTACHAAAPNTVNGGPHGLHPVGQTWVSRHGSTVERVGSSGCRPCHGADYRGTVLSNVSTDRRFTTGGGARTFTRGTPIGCYSCHNGPNGG